MGPQMFARERLIHEGRLAEWSGWALMLVSLGFLLSHVAEVGWNKTGRRSVLTVAAIDMHELDGSRKYDLQALVRNQTGVLVRIIGASAICTTGGCASVETLPIDIPPGGRASLRVHYAPRGSGSSR